MPIGRATDTRRRCERMRFRTWIAVVVIAPMSGRTLAVWPLGAGVVAT